MRVQIDGDRCQGHGRCYDLAPDVFTDDDEGYSQLVGDGTIASADADRARRAVANCPENAISIVEES